MRAVADTGPLHYLVLTRHIGILANLFNKVAIPERVRNELADPDAPLAVQDWIAAPPAWLSMNAMLPNMLDRVDAALDAGERATLALAIEQQPDLVLIDDRAGVAAAHQLGFVVTRTLGLLERAARRNLLDLHHALDALARTNFRWTPSLRARVLAERMSNGFRDRPADKGVVRK